MRTSTPEHPSALLPSIPSPNGILAAIVAHVVGHLTPERSAIVPTHRVSDDPEVSYYIRQVLQYQALDDRDA